MSLIPTEIINRQNNITDYKNHKTNHHIAHFTLYPTQKDNKEAKLLKYHITPRSSTKNPFQITHEFITQHEFN